MKTLSVILSAILLFAASAVSASAASYAVSQGWNMISLPDDYASITKCVDEKSISGMVIKDTNFSVGIKTADGRYEIFVTAGANNNWASFQIKDMSGKVVDTVSNISERGSRESSSAALKITLNDVTIADATPHRIESNIFVSDVDQYNTISGTMYSYNPWKNNYDVLTMSSMSGVPIRGKGIWIHKSSKGSCALTLRTAVSKNYSQTISLKKGWNQIATPLGTVSMEDFKGNCKIANGPFEYSAAQNKYARSDKLEEGKGYWVYAEKDCTLEKTCSSRGGTCRAWDIVNGNCYSSEREISPFECANNKLQTHCCVPK